MAAAEASTPGTLVCPAAVSSMRNTPPMPMTAPAMCTGSGRSESSTQASRLIATGEVAIRVEAVEVGSNCAARYTRTKKAATLSVPSSADRHHHDPLGRVRHTASSMSPAGRARMAAPYSGRPGGRNWRVTK